MGPIPGTVEILYPEAAGVGTVIWCTGFTADFGWLHLPLQAPQQEVGGDQRSGGRCRIRRRVDRCPSRRLDEPVALLVQWAVLDHALRPQPGQVEDRFSAEDQLTQVPPHRRRLLEAMT